MHYKKRLKKSAAQIHVDGRVYHLGVFKTAEEAHAASPGWAGGKSGIVQVSSMVIDDFDIVGVTIAPAKTDPPLVVDADAVLSFTIARQAFQPIARRSLEIIEAVGIVNLHQLPVRSVCL